LPAGVWAARCGWKINVARAAKAGGRIIVRITEGDSAMLRTVLKISGLRQAREYGSFGASPVPMATTSTTARGDLFPFELVRPQLERVEASIREQVRGFDPAIEPYVAYVCNTSGKRIRPALAALVGGAAGGVTGDHVKLGVIMELIHMATLVHDDIIDGATTRRMVPTANAKWGNSLSVLLGDALFSHALTLARSSRPSAAST
jgi:hypothetical protein